MQCSIFCLPDDVTEVRVNDTVFTLITALKTNAVHKTVVDLSSA